MNLDTFFEKFYLFADAPGAVAKMRELILHLAVHGKLVVQSAGDEPATELLKRSRAEMAKRMAARQAKQEKPAEPVSSDEATFSLPTGWAWCRLVDAAQFINGLAFKPSDWGNAGRPIIRIQNLSGRNIDYNRTTGRYDSSVLVQDGDILVSWSATLDAYIWRGEEGVLNQHIFRVLPASLADKGFLFWLLKWVIRQLAESDHAHGLVMSHINRGPFLARPIPLPPLAEQKRIVAKVDELMALCDLLEAQQQEREEQKATLTRASLARFADAPTPANLNYLFHQSYDITPADLRKSILTLAVQGKLVPQDPDDEPVQDALARSDARRRDMARSDRRADETNQPLLSADDRWDIADTWAWRGLADLVLFVDYRGKTPEKLSSGVRLLTAKNVRKGQISPSPEEFLSENEYSAWMSRGFPKAGDVLFTTEAPMGNAAVVALTERFALAQRVICFQNYGAIDPGFLVLQILSDVFQFILDKNGTGMTAKGIKASKLKQLPIALPPLAEQKRIVAKVEQLMALVDALETQLAASRSAGEKLLAALVAELTAGKESLAAS